jgi:hypothetical protein
MYFGASKWSPDLHRLAGPALAVISWGWKRSKPILFMGSWPETRQNPFWCTGLTHPTLGPGPSLFHASYKLLHLEDFWHDLNIISYNNNNNNMTSRRITDTEASINFSILRISAELLFEELFYMLFYS